MTNNKIITLKKMLNVAPEFACTADKLGRGGVMVTDTVQYL